jgi:hypothetical protein
MCTVSKREPAIQAQNHVEQPADRVNRKQSMSQLPTKLGNATLTVQVYLNKPTTTNSPGNQSPNPLHGQSWQRETHPREGATTTTEHLLIRKITQYVGRQASLKHVAKRRTYTRNRGSIYTHKHSSITRHQRARQKLNMFPSNIVQGCVARPHKHAIYRARTAQKLEPSTFSI